MAAPIQSDVRTFEQGVIESISEYARTNSFNSAQEVWLVPGYEGVLGEYGPYTLKESQSGPSPPAPKVASAITAKDSSGNVYRVAHDIINAEVYPLDVDGLLGVGGALKSSTSTTTPMSFTVYNDKILCFDGVTTPFQILIASPNTVSNIGVTQPTVTNASTSDNDVAGNVKGTVKYYISQMSTTTEGALSVAFGEIDASLNQDGQGTQITIDLSHLDFAVTNGTITSTQASPATTLTDSGADFTALGVQVGMTVRNITDGSKGTVTAVGTTTVTHAALAGGSDNNWDTSDTYRVDPNYRIYRTYANREAPNYLAEQPGGQTYTDNVVDDDLGDLPRLHGDPPPAAITSAAVYNDVIYGVAGNTLYWSDPGEEESWWTATDGNSLSLDRGDGDVGKALFVEPDGVVIFKRHHILKLLGSGPADYRLVPITPSDQSAPSVGTESINSICGIPGGAFFFYEGGFYVYSQGQVQRVSEAIDRLFFAAGVHGAGASGVLRYDPRFGVVHCGFQLQVPATKGATPDVEAATLAFHVPTRRWIGTGKVITGKTGNVVSAMMYDPEQGEFSQFDYWVDAVAGYSHYWIAPDQDLELPSDADLLSTADAQLVLPRFYGQTEFTEKRFLWVEIEALGTASADGTMKVEYSINGSAYATAGTATLSATRAKRRFNIGEYGREMDIRLTMDEGFRIYRAICGFQEFGSKSV